MFEIPSSTRPDGASEPSWENVSIRSDFGEDATSLIIDRANTVPITKILAHYRIRTDNTDKIICPFKHHKNGKESSPSFMIYRDENSFHCFGCKSGSKPCNFVASMDKIPLYLAAIKILNKFSDEVDDSKIVSEDFFPEKIELFMNFSSKIYEFKKQFNTAKSKLFIDDVCKAFDNINAKYDLSNDAIKFMINRLNNKIEEYKE